MPADRLRLAVVVQRYGADIGAGSEGLARQVAERMARRGHAVDVLTTCALDYVTWADHYPPGETMENGVRVRRFGVATQRDMKAFDLLSLELYARERTRDEELEWVRQQGPDAPGLIDALAREGASYDVVCFFTYLYATTALGLPLVRDRAVLVPTAHEEDPIHFGVYRELFAAPRHLVFLSPGEQRLVHGLFGNPEIPYTLAGVGVDLPPSASAYRFRRAHDLWRDLLVYVGRVDVSKGVHVLFDHFERYRRESGSGLDLVLLGRQAMAIPKVAGIVPLGYVDEQTKADALAAATAFVLPSHYESFSIATMEAWQQGVPGLLNGDDPVMVDHCRWSQAGLYYHGYAEFALALHTLRSDAALRNRMGANGRRYVDANYRWARIEPLFEAALRAAAAPPIIQVSSGSSAAW